MSQRRKPAPVKVTHADGSIEVRKQSDFPKRPPVARGKSRKARAKRRAAREQRALEVSIARDQAAMLDKAWTQAMLHDDRRVN